MKLNRIFFFAVLFVVNVFSMQLYAQGVYQEQHRPQVHFSPKEKWVNDPNGMVYMNGVYHLFFQYYPDSTIWGPMHWGHATSKDLIHWKELPIALYPDSLGYIFSGSAVIDYKNTSGFAKNGETAMVAIFTSHNPKAPVKTETEHQSIAYSLDNGNTWVKYAHNPVVKNPGIADFRDPKVMWYEPAKKWIMTLAAGDRVIFYSSPNLKDWKKESDFGNAAGAHGGGWECPDLFALDYMGKKVWVLIANLNPGGPNKGSATQYFLGSFNGNKFTPLSTATKWLDYGPDDYAGITWSNTGSRKIFIGWMSNWMYANEVPTEKWRNAMTLPRELKLKVAGKEMYVVAEPVKELAAIAAKPVVIENMAVSKSVDLSKQIKDTKLPCRINLSMDTIKDFSITLSNGINEAIKIGYHKSNNQYYIDRTKSGKTDFNNEFAAVHTAPRLTSNNKMNLWLVIDVSSIELFADDGLTVMTQVFFPHATYQQFTVQAPNTLLINKLEYTSLKSIWP